MMRRTKAEQLVAAYRAVAAFGHFLVAIGDCHWTSEHIDAAEALLLAAQGTDPSADAYQREIGALNVLSAHRAQQGRWLRLHPIEEVGHGV